MPQAPREKGASELVRCLECAMEYVKPLGGGTRTSNPGCPRCGYVGWLAVSVGEEIEAESREAESLEPGSLTPESPRGRYDADPQWQRLGQRR